MIVFPNSKINLGLNIVSKREDGYHDIETIFYPIKLHDALEITVSEGNNQFFTTGFNLDGKLTDNICYKTYTRFKQLFEIPKINCHLHKAVPVGAGLGGGTADAAYMMKLLNEFFNLQLSEAQLSKFASKMGADCAFFLKNKPVFAKGIGDDFEDINLSLQGKYIVLAKPPVNICTKTAYSSIKPKAPKIPLKEAILEPIEKWRKLIFNDFEENIFSMYPEIRKIKDILFNNGAKYASMSGSGSTVYGIFDEAINLKALFPDNYFYWSDEML